MNEIENRIVREAQSGDVDAFERLVVDYEKKVYNIAYQMFNNEQDAYDASQEVFIKIYRNLKSFQFESGFGTWLHRLAVNTCIDLYRKKKRQFMNETAMDDPVQSDQDAPIQRQFQDEKLTPEQQVIQNETVSEVQRAIQELKDDYKMIIILRDIRGHSYEEITQMLECQMGTVKSRLARARSSLKEIIIKNRELKT